MSGLSRVTEDDRFNLGIAVTPEAFLEFVRGKDLDDLRSRTSEQFGLEFSYFLQEPPGSDFRYVYDPAHPGKVLDLHHFLAAAEQGGRGEFLGFLQEIKQGLDGYWGSALREEDLRSNAEGGNEFPQYLRQHGSLEAAFRQYFQDRAQEEVPLRQRDRPRGATYQLEVEVTQELLENLGYLQRNQIDGRFGPQTTKALQEFQGDRGLPETGTLDFQTWKALAREGDTKQLTETAKYAAEFEKEHGNLSFRETGDKVETVQAQLVERGYLSAAEIDGRFDRTTVAAVRTFQEENGLPVNGTIDFRTYRALTETAPVQERDALPSEQPQASQPYPTLRLQDSGPEVEALQTHLKNLAYEVGEIDGRYGAQTAAAVREFQQDNSLSPDGEAGPLTWQALTEATAERSQPQARDTDAPAAPPPVAPQAPQDSLPRRLWRNFTDALGIAAAGGRDEVSFALPSNGREIAISGETATQTVWGTIGQERELFAKLQVRDGELFADIPQREVAEETARHLGNAIQVAESISREPQTALEA